MKAVVVKVRCVSVKRNEAYRAAVQMIKAGQPVFFGCDVAKFSDKDFGIMDTALFEYEVSR
jgi:bleomycin hydrolase